MIQVDLQVKRIIDQVKEWVASGIYEKIYVNKGIKRELGPGNFKNTQPDVWGVRSGNGKIDQVEVPSKTDKDWKLRDKMKTNQAIMGQQSLEIFQMSIKTIHCRGRI